jgi:hypothetical protein
MQDEGEAAAGSALQIALRPAAVAQNPGDHDSDIT